MVFDQLPDADDIGLVYAKGSRSGATGVTIFNYIVTNTVAGGSASEQFLDTATLQSGIYTLRIAAADYFGNTSYRDINLEVLK